MEIDCILRSSVIMNFKKNFENYLLKISKSLKIPLIATQEIFYLNEDMFEAHDALICIEKKF